MAVNILGILSIVVFYVVILVVGIWAARIRGKQRQRANANGESGADGGDDSNEVMLAGRSIGMVVGAFTMTATWVGGGYINGTSEAVSRQGLVWAQSPWGYSLSLVLGGFLFAKIMRRRGYVTLLDPFQERYGARIGGIMYIPAFLGELLWSAATLNSLGATISVVMDWEMSISVIVSACIALFYTFFGGLWSVAYTDVAQLICMFIGMWLTIPFASSNKVVGDIGATLPQWKGEWQWSEAGVWFDYAFLLIFGGIPWQVYFQRVLSSKTHSRAQYLSFAAAVGCLVMAIPSILIGAIGASTDWEQTAYADRYDVKRINGTLQIDYQKMMPLVLQYLTPSAISFVGLGAVSAAVMSSVDSSVLSASSMFAHNIYKTILRQNASEREMIWVLRISILIVGAIATVIGLTVKTIYGLSILCSDLIYVILFPQLICVLYFRYSNGYGATFSFFVGMLLRLLGGEKMIGMEAAIKYPWFDYVNGVQKFPFRTLSMIVTTITLIVASIVTHVLFQREILPQRWDVAGVFDDDTTPFSFTDMFVFDQRDEKQTYEVNGNTEETRLVEMNGKHKEEEPVAL